MSKSLTFEKISAGIYRTRAGDCEVQARKVAEGVWMVESRSWSAGGAFDFVQAESTLRDAKARAGHFLAGVL